MVAAFFCSDGKRPWKTLASGGLRQAGLPQLLRLAKPCIPVSGDCRHLHKYFKDCADGVLLTSRGGLRYDRSFMEGFLRPGVGVENWVSRDNYPCPNVVETGPAEMSLYVNRHYGQPSARLTRFTLRVDGFTSLYAPYAAGEMVTHPLRFSGKELELNYATSAAGSIRVELQKPDGAPISGFGAEDCREIIGDRVKRAVVWKAAPDLSTLAGQPVRLRFRMKDAEVFSSRFRG